MEDSTPLSASVMMGDSVKDLGAPLLPSTGRASFKPSVKRRRLVFDMLFGVLFGIFAIVMVVLAFTMGLQAVSNRKTPAVVTVDDKEEPTSRMVTSMEGLKALIGVVIVSAVGIFMSTAWIQVMIWCAPALIGYTLLSIALLGVGSAITFFATGNITGGVVTTVVTLVGLSYFHILKRRVHFASANIKVACQAIRDNPPVLALGFLLLLLQVAWSLIWTLAVLGAATNAKATTITAAGHTYSMSQCTTYKVAAPNMDFSPSCAATTGGWCTKCMCAGSLVYDGRGCFSYRLYGGWLAVLLLGFVWGCTVLRNIGHCAISGTVGMWWISGSNRSSMAVWSNLRRALTSSFGSICLGSLLVAIIKTLRQILLAMHKSNRSTTRMNTLSAVLDCMLAVVDRALSLFNKYALVYVALYGLDFMSAGAATTELFKARGITAIVNDTLIDTVLGLGSMIVGLVCAVVSYLYGVDAGLSHPNVVVLTVAGAFIGAALGFVVATIMESAVSTVFVCFAEDPKALEISHPDLSDRLVEAWETMLQGPISELGASGLSKEGLGGSWQGAPAPAASEIETTMTSSGVVGAPAMPEGDVEEKKCMDV